MPRAREERLFFGWCECSAPPAADRLEVLQHGKSREASQPGCRGELEREEFPEIVVVPDLCHDLRAPRREVAERHVVALRERLAAEQRGARGALAREDHLVLVVRHGGDDDTAALQEV
ncbi:hypothetical protein [Leucobacter chromiireducens]|uniref:hypothetical protein n=1 Tax=Leucobacter chromiireducens TaxID=283877 RepID=UPI003F7F3163